LILGIGSSAKAVNKEEIPRAIIAASRIWILDLSSLLKILRKYSARNGKKSTYPKSRIMGELAEFLSANQLEAVELKPQQAKPTLRRISDSISSAIARAKTIKL
jgi:hypothetical protein